MNIKKDTISDPLRQKQLFWWFTEQENLKTSNLI